MTALCETLRGLNGANTENNHPLFQLRSYQHFLRAFQEKK
jgi:hypothetical protein